MSGERACRIGAALMVSVFLPGRGADGAAGGPLFQAAAEATEEAIYNSLFRATTVQGHRGRVEALPLDRTLEVLRRHGALRSEPRRD
jgi:hypothetical protein